MTTQKRKNFNICTIDYAKVNNDKLIKCTRYYIKKENGEMVELPECVEGVEKFLVCQKYCKFSYDGLWGLMDTDGNGVVPAGYQGIQELVSGGRFLKFCFDGECCRIWDAEYGEFICDGKTFSGTKMAYMSQGVILVRDKKGFWQIYVVKNRQLLEHAYEKIDFNDKRYLIGWSKSESNFHVFDMSQCREVVKLGAITVTNYEIKGKFILVRELGSFYDEDFEVYSLETGCRLFSLRGKFVNTVIVAISEDLDVSYRELFESFFKNVDKEYDEILKKANWLFFNKDFIIGVSVLYRTGVNASVDADSQVVDYYGDSDLGKNSAKVNDILFKINNDLDDAYFGYI